MNDTRRTPTTTLRLGIALVIALSSIAFAAGTADADDDMTVDVIVVDDHGHPFPKGNGGALACPVESAGVPCTSGFVANRDDDGDGIVHLTLHPWLAYFINGFAMNTGWKDPWIAPDGTTFHFSPVLEIVSPWQIVNGKTTFVVTKPKAPPKHPETVDLKFKVVDGNGNPFPANGFPAVFAGCPAPDLPWYQGCPGLTGAHADANGNVTLTVDKDTPYSFAALVQNTGWCGGWTSPGGLTFWFSTETTTAYSRDVAHLPKLDRTFHIVQPTTCP